MQCSTCEAKRVHFFYALRAASPRPAGEADSIPNDRFNDPVLRRLGSLRNQAFATSECSRSFVSPDPCRMTKRVEDRRGAAAPPMRTRRDLFVQPLASSSSPDPAQARAAPCLSRVSWTSLSVATCTGSIEIASELPHRPVLGL